MRTECVQTPEGIVVRRIWATGENAYRRAANNLWDYCADHKGPWVGVRGDDVPADVWRALDDFLQNPVRKQDAEA